MSLREIEDGEDKREEREGAQIGKGTENKLGEKPKLLGGWCKARPLREIEGREDT